jgi:protein-tyrosine phosphatase
LSALVDVHCHVVPGVDDGAADLQTALEMLRASARSGVGDVIATPHQHPVRYPNEAAALREAHASLLEARAERVAAGEDLPRVHLGAEVHLDEGLVARLREGRLLSLAAGPWVLLELPDVFPTAAAEQALYELQVAGFRVVLAHPERVGQLARRPRLIELLVERGALCQVTAHSVSGRFGPDCRELTERLLRAGLVHLVASDGHDLERRPCGLREALDAVRATFGEAEARRLFETAPRALLEGRGVDAPPARSLEPDEQPGLAGRLGRWLRGRGQPRPF